MHVAIIPDGNRRWAKAKGLIATQGHREAVRNNRLSSFLQQAKELEIEHVSLWVFSTENWKRPKEEVDKLIALLLEKIGELKEIAQKENIRLNWLGRRDRVSEQLRKDFEQVIEETKNNDSLTFNLCLDYGGRDEIVRAVNKAIAKGEPVTEENFGQFLDTHGLPDPDLIIRTSGERRLSGLFPWQGTYAELFFANKFFPDFSPEDLAQAVNEFKSRQRRFGGD